MIERMHISSKNRTKHPYNNKKSKEMGTTQQGRDKDSNVQQKAAYALGKMKAMPAVGGDVLQELQRRGHR
jgi:hypothetical protein